MHLAIDGQRLGAPLSGVSRYLRELLRQWASMALPFTRVTLYVPAPPEAGTFPAEAPFELRVLPERVDPAVWTHWTLARAARGADLLFCPSYVAPVAAAAPFAVTIHDALPAFMPAASPSLRRRARIALVRRSARRARLVLTPSESTRRDVERFYGVPPSRSLSIPLGVDPALASPVTAEEARAVRGRYGLGSEPFVLFVGKLARRRNLPLLADAFADARARVGSAARLVLVGADSAGLTGELARRDPETIRVTGHVPDDDLRVLYREAAIFVHPSSYEGFGLPLVEAMAAGAPVITIASSSLGEVAGDAALVLSEPTRPGLADAIAGLLASAARREELAARGRERARRFTWAATAEATMAALAEAARRPATRPGSPG